MRQATLQVGKVNKQQGFTYIMMLAALVIVMILSTVASVFTSHQVRADKEAELIFRGLAYRAAIESYYQSHKIIKKYPARLEDLLIDNRFVLRRHIRELYQDPVSKEEWRLIYGSGGGIMGVASRSDLTPLKVAGFPKALKLFEGATSYADWRFEYIPSKKRKPTKK